MKKLFSICVFLKFELLSGFVWTTIIINYYKIIKTAALIILVTCSSSFTKNIETFSIFITQIN